MFSDSIERMSRSVVGGEISSGSFYMSNVMKPSAGAVEDVVYDASQDDTVEVEVAVLAETHRPMTDPEAQIEGSEPTGEGEDREPVITTDEESSVGPPVASLDQPEIRLNAGNTLPENTETSDGFDLASLALPQDFASMIQVDTVVMTVPVKKPNKQTWFACHPDRKTWIPVAVLRDETDGENYVLTERVRQTIPDDWVPKVLVPCITRQGTLMLWPIKTPGPDGKLDSWNQSAISIVTTHGGQWIRVNSNRESGGYEVNRPVSPYSPPVWPEDLAATFKRASKEFVIDDVNHPILKRLRGEE